MGKASKQKNKNIKKMKELNMGIKDIKRKQTQVKDVFAKLGLSTDELKDVTADVVYDFSLLKEEYVDCSRSLLTQLANCGELINLYAEKLKLPENEETLKTVNGLIKVYSDLGEDLIAISKEHIVSEEEDKDGNRTNIVFKDGEVDKDDIDGQMKYLNIYAKYGALQEKINRITSKGYLDVITQIMTDPDFKDDKIIEEAKRTLEEYANTEPITDNIIEKILK